MASRGELSSLATALEELMQRVTALADECAAAKRDDAASDLYDAERSLGTAHRRLRRALDSLP